MTTPINKFVAKDEATIRDDLLRSKKNALANRGVTNLQYGPGTDEYISATATARELAVCHANTQILADQLMPDTATGSSLDRQLTIYGLSRRGASGSTGYVIFSSSQSSPVTVGTQLLDSTGLRYQVSVGGTYANNATIPVAAVDTGAATNHSAGDILRWVTVPPFANSTVSVAVGGLTGASDTENDDTARARLLARLSVPPGAGNWSQMAALAAAASNKVQGAAVYPAVNGPGTVHVAIFGYTSSVQASNAKNRDVDTTTTNSIVAPYVGGNMAEYAELVLTTVTNVPIDVAFQLSLPASQNASPPGPGGGWLDGTPWPTLTGGATSCAVTSVTSSTVFTVNANTAPAANVSRVAFLDPTTWVLNTAKVTAFSGSSGAYTITIDNPWPNIATGNFVWPQSANQAAYVAAALAAFASMGPGEKTAAAGPLVRGFRRPVPTSAWPYTVGPWMLRYLTNAGTEVSSAAFYTPSTVQTPAVPASVASAPNIYVPRNIGFYQ